MFNSKMLFLLQKLFLPLENFSILIGFIDYEFLGSSKASYT